MDIWLSAIDMGDYGMIWTVFTLDCYVKYISGPYGPPNVCVCARLYRYSRSRNKIIKSFLKVVPSA